MRLIDVSVLKEWVENWFTKNRFYHPYAKNNNIPITELYDILEQMPTIEERKTGKWIIEPYDAQNDIFIHRCGTCMRVAMLGGHTTKFKYCPICGSAMEGEQSVTD